MQGYSQGPHAARVPQIGRPGIIIVLAVTSTDRINYARKEFW
jgi:hypothetical protein